MFDRMFWKPLTARLSNATASNDDVCPRRTILAAFIRVPHKAITVHVSSQVFKVNSTALLPDDEQSGWFTSKLQGHFNWLNDWHWNWTPFFNLRPEKHQYIGISVILVFSTFCFAPIAVGGGLCILVFLTDILGMALNPASLFAVAGTSLSLLTAFTHQYVSFHYWNRRAHSIRKSNEFVPPVDDAYLVATDTLTTDDPFRPPRVATSTVDPDQPPPLPLRHLVNGGELLFGVGTLVVFGATLPFNLDFVLPGMDLLQFLLRPILWFLIIVALIVVFCTSRISTADRSSTRLGAFLVKLAISVFWMLASLLFAACVLVSADEPSLPLLIWAWSLFAATFMLTASILQYRRAERRFDPVMAASDDSFGWNVS